MHKNLHLSGENSQRWSCMESLIREWTHEWRVASGEWLSHLAFGIWHLAFGIWHLAFVYSRKAMNGQNCSCMDRACIEHETERKIGIGAKQAWGGRWLSKQTER